MLKYFGLWKLVCCTMKISSKALSLVQQHIWNVVFMACGNFSYEVLYTVGNFSFFFSFNDSQNMISKKMTLQLKQWNIKLTEAFWRNWRTICVVQHKLYAALQTRMRFMMDKQSVVLTDRASGMHEELLLVWSWGIHVFLALHIVSLSWRVDGFQLFIGICALPNV
jgi:hypothetical protein